MPRCQALCQADSPMDSPIPSLPVLQHQAESAMFQRLSEFQAKAVTQPPVSLTLSAVLSRALPAFELGFSYTASHWNGELAVTLHYQGAELGSSLSVTPEGYSDATARLLAGLLGIPLLELNDPSEAEAEPPIEVINPDAAEQPEGEEEEAAPVVQEPAEDLEEEEFDDAPAAAVEDVRRPLNDLERQSAIDMVKAMEPANRKAFTRAYREEFQVPPEAKQISPHITELRHLHFIDRFTVEAAGGVAA